MRINTNVASMTAQESAANTTRATTSSLEKLSTGYQINKVHNNYKAQIRKEAEAPFLSRNTLATNGLCKWKISNVLINRLLKLFTSRKIWYNFFWHLHKLASLRVANLSRRTLFNLKLTKTGKINRFTTTKRVFY